MDSGSLTGRWRQERRQILLIGQRFFRGAHAQAYFAISVPTADLAQRCKAISNP
jgi:hypothetical protein